MTTMVDRYIEVALSRIPGGSRNDVEREMRGMIDELVDGQVDDPRRVDYLKAHLGALRIALDEGAPVKGYFAWSLMDNFEWARGYDKRFGLVHVDYDTLVRTPKASARWYSDTIRANGFTL